MSPARSLIWSIACQVIGFVGGMMAGELVGPIGALVFYGLLSGLAAQFLGLSVPWIGFNVLLPLGLAISTEVVLPAWVIAFTALILLFLFVPTLESGVPLYLSSREMYEEVASILPRDREFNFIDLGCGTSGILVYLARQFPRGKFVGVELAPMPFAISWLRAVIQGKGRIRVRFGSLWKVDVSPYDVIYAFLAPPPMEQVWKKVKEEMKNDAVFLSNSFEVPGVRAEERRVEGIRQQSLFIYRRRI